MRVTHDKALEANPSDPVGPQRWLLDGPGRLENYGRNIMTNENLEVARELLAEITESAKSGSALVLGPQAVANLHVLLGDLLRKTLQDEPGEPNKLPLRVVVDSNVPPDTIEFRRPDGALLGTIHNIAVETCEDCPPVGYPTDKTRCAPCPRRAVK